MQPDAPKTSSEIGAPFAKPKRDLDPSPSVLQPDVSGNPEPEVREAAAIAVQAGREIATSFRGLATRQRRSIVTAFRSQLLSAWRISRWERKTRTPGKPISLIAASADRDGRAAGEKLP